MIVGTAGHIDHGKTTLVRALTGVNTDRLKEEQQRGISIELGYAYLPLDNGQVLGFIDVPGHERLIHTMTAGASGIDFGLLVVAADDGVMPQTHEHLSILSMLGITQGAVAISKAGKASAQRRDALRAELAQLVQQTFLQDRPVFFVEAVDPDDVGVAQLRHYLCDSAQALSERTPDGLFRLAIDRVFTLKGHGTVVTGTVHDGVLCLDQPVSDLRLMPAGQKVRVRSIHVQNQSARQARAGDRCALNLAGVDRDAIHRGDWVADARCFTPSRNVDVRIQLVDGSGDVRTWSPFHIHLGASHFVAHTVPLSGTTIPAAASGWAQLVFDTPICAMPGDRFIMRDAQARHTVGGGVVLDPNAPQRKRRSALRLSWLQAVSDLHDEGEWSHLLQHAPYGLSEHEVMRLARCTADCLPVPDGAVWLAAPNGQLSRTLILASHRDLSADALLQRLHSFHQRWPDEPGVDAARLRRMALPSSPEPLWLALLGYLRDRRDVERNGPWWHLPGHVVALAPQDAVLAETLLPLLHHGGFDPPWVRDLAGQTGYAEQRVRDVLLKLLRTGDVVQVVHDLFYHREQVVVLAELLGRLAIGSGVTAGHFRDAVGLGRKRSIQLLEFFNRTGYTRRLHDRHVLRSDGIHVWQQVS